MTSIVLNVPSQQAGAILGQGGARVSAIRSDTGSDVRIQQSGSGVLLRRVEIKGDNSMSALRQVLTAIEESEKDNDEVSLQLVISSNFAGGVIGPQGQTIQGIRQANPGAQVHMEKNSGYSPERLIHVTGAAADVSSAIIQVVQVIEDGLKDGSLTAHSPVSKRARTSIEKNGHQNFGRTRNNAEKDHNNDRFYGYPRGRTEGQMTLNISNEQAGKIIGKGGRQIHVIRQKCGCRIDLEPRGEQRALRVTGALCNIEEACRILSMYLDE